MLLYNLKMVQVCDSFQGPVLPRCLGVCVFFLKSPEAGHGPCLSKSRVLVTLFFLGFSTDISHLCRQHYTHYNLCYITDFLLYWNTVFVN